MLWNTHTHTHTPLPPPHTPTLHPPPNPSSTQNRSLLADQSVPVEDRLCTFDGPPHRSRAVNCSGQLRKSVALSCQSIADHFAANSLAHKGTKHQIARMVVQFKPDRHGRLCLLYMTGVRVFAVGKKADVLLALNLAPRYVHAPCTTTAPADSPPGADAAAAPPLPAARLEPGGPRAAALSTRKLRALKKAACGRAVCDALSATAAAAGAAPTAGNSRAPVASDAASSSAAAAAARARWRMVQRAVRCRFPAVCASAQELVGEIRDACYRVASSRLARSGRDLALSLPPFHPLLRGVAARFLAAVGVEVEGGVAAGFAVQETEYVARAGDLFECHMCDVVAARAEDDAEAVLDGLRARLCDEPAAAAAAAGLLAGGGGVGGRAGVAVEEELKAEGCEEGSDGDASSGCGEEALGGSSEMVAAVNSTSSSSYDDGDFDADELC